MYKEFDKLPDDARLWIFPIETRLGASEEDNLRASMRTFIESWEAHKLPVVGGVEIVYGSFILVAANTKMTDVSGCSIDSLTRAVNKTLAEVGNGLGDIGKIYVREQDGVVHYSRKVFKEKLANGVVLPTTQVFDNTIETLAQLRAGLWERPISQTWHADAFGITAEQR